MQSPAKVLLTVKFVYIFLFTQIRYYLAVEVGKYCLIQDILTGKSVKGMHIHYTIYIYTVEVGKYCLIQDILTGKYVKGMHIQYTYDASTFKITFLPVSPASPMGPPITKLPQGLMCTTVLWSRYFRGMVLFTTFSRTSALRNSRLTWNS